MPHASGWTMIKGSGLAVEGPCVLLGVIFTPDTTNDYVTIYDGIDAASGRKFAKITTAVDVTWPFHMSCHPLFAAGVYVEGIDSAVETTIIYESVE